MTNTANSSDLQKGSFAFFTLFINFKNTESGGTTITNVYMQLCSRKAFRRFCKHLIPDDSGNVYKFRQD